jgi:replicative DNA helicase
MLEQKIINWMMNGIQETSQVYRSLEFQLLYEAASNPYKEVFRVINEQYNKYKTPPSYDILKSLLSDKIKFVTDQIREDSCSENEIGYFLDLYKKNYNKRLASELSKIIEASEDNIPNINNNLKNALSKIERLNRNAVFSEGTFTATIEERLNNYHYVRENPNQVAGVFSGYRQIDDYTWGIKNSEMMIISGATSSGKSLLMMNMAINAWLGSNSPADFDGSYANDGKNIVYFTLEMSKAQLEQRIDACMAGIRHRSIMRGSLTDDEMRMWKRSIHFQKNYDKNFYVIDMPRGSKTLEIEAKFDNIVNQFKPDLVCVDYLGIMKSNKSYGSDWEDMGHIAEDLHEFCRKKNIPVITAAQRKGRIRSAGKGKAETIEDSEEIGRSKMIGDNANIILLIENRNEEHLREDMVIHVTKNRDGAKGKIVLLKEFQYSKISNLPENWSGQDGLEDEV